MCPLPQSSTTTMCSIQGSSLGKDPTLQSVRSVKGDTREIPETVVEVEVDQDELVKTRASFSSSDSSCTVNSSGELSPLDELLVEKLGKAMEAIAKGGDMIVPLNSHRQDVGAFSCKSGKLPPISLRSYLRRMVKYIDNGNCSTSWASLSAGMKALISAIIFVDRIVLATGITVTSMNIHRLMAAGMLVALKINEDAVVDTGLYAALAGVQAKEMVKLECTLLEKLDWNTFISEAEFSTRINSFQRLTASRKTSTRVAKPSSH